MNKIIYFSLILICFGAISCQTKLQENFQSEPLRHVGDILENPALDTANFQPCEEHFAHQYYNFGNSIQYTGEKAAVIDFVYEEFESNPSIQDSGYVTIRFMVNCKGESGRFRVYQMDKDYQLISLNKSLVDQIVGIVMRLDEWKIGFRDNGDAYDYYQYLTFKIEEGQITDIMP